MGIKFDRDPLAVEQKNCASKIVDVYIVYDLDVWPRKPVKNVKFQDYLFGATSVVKIGYLY